MNILVIEDSPMQAKIAQQMMAKVSSAHQVDIADCCDAAREKILGMQYDIILVDFGLPDGNGLELTRELRDSGVTSYMYALSGNFDTVPLEDRKAAGLDGGCRKPFSFDKAEEVVRSYRDAIGQK